MSHSRNVPCRKNGAVHQMQSFTPYLHLVMQLVLDCCSEEPKDRSLSLAVDIHSSIGLYVHELQVVTKRMSLQIQAAKVSL